MHLIWTLCLLHVQGPEVAIHHSDEVLAGMNKWCVEHHASSGLTERCRASQTSMAEAEAQARAPTLNTHHALLPASSAVESVLIHGQ